MMTTQRALRAAYWREREEWTGQSTPRGWKSAGQNNLPADVRADWCEFVDTAERHGIISPTLAMRVTL